MYGLGIGLSFADRWLGIAVYIAVALMWLIPDRRVERTLTRAHQDAGPSHPDDAPAWVAATIANTACGPNSRGVRTPLSAPRHLTSAESPLAHTSAAMRAGCLTIVRAV
jgi:hypothetical protein